MYVLSLSAASAGNASRLGKIQAALAAADLETIPIANPALLEKVYRLLARNSLPQRLLRLFPETSAKAAGCTLQCGLLTRCFK